jgi:hypothetical protein
MMKCILPALILILTLAGCGAPEKYSARKVAVCESPGTSLKGVPYTRGSASACAVAIAPFDLGVWQEAPYNSHKVRGLKTVDLGCSALIPEAEDCGYAGPPGQSKTLLLSFDPSVYPEGGRVNRAILAVYALNNPEGLREARLRGRLSTGDDQQSLAKKREIWTEKNRTDQGWVFYDVSLFVARAINERRTSIQFEISLPCGGPEQNPVTAGVLKNEPRLVVEFE